MVALWREALLAQKVLRGQTKGYRHHPQLKRFQATSAPISAIATYLVAVHDEASERTFRFNAGKIARSRFKERISVTDGQLGFEMEHLMRKLWKRDRNRYKKLQGVRIIEAHPIFKVVKGDVSEWENV